MGAAKKDNESSVSFNRQNMGSADSLRYQVLNEVVESQYDRAVQHLDKFIKQDFEYPKFKSRAEKYIMHAIDLVNAIRAKRNFPGINSLTVAKQQELNEKIKVHFEELKETLEKVEKVQHELKVEDVRSTVWVVKALINALVAIVLIAFLNEAAGGLLKTLLIVVDELMIHSTSWIFDKLNI